MTLPTLPKAVLCSLLALLTNFANAQSPPIAQDFELHVPPRFVGRVNILAPVDITLAHDTTDDNQVFPDQHWDVGCNARRGASVTFITLNAFQRAGGGPTVQRDARLDLSFLSSEPSANWSITKATDQTNYRGGFFGRFATVTAESTSPGDATFRLKVSFVTEDYATLPTGTYQTTVFGIISAN